MTFRIDGHLSEFTWAIPFALMELVFKLWCKLSLVKNQNNNYFPQIDGLRAIAVLAVIFYHLRQSLLPGGFAGVDVFFVISGFVVSASASRMTELTLGSFLLRFYSSRIKRILPALLLCLTVTTILSTLFIPSAWLSGGYFKVGFFAFFGLSNIALSEMDNYFSPRAEFNPYTHTWSLGVEEQFYFLFPFLVYASKKLPTKSKLTPFLVGLIISVIAAVLLQKANGTSAFYSIFSRFWELCFGIVLYQLMSLKTLPQKLSPRALNFGSFLSLGLILWSFWNSNPSKFPAPGAVAPVLGTLGFLYFTCSHSISTITSRLLSNSHLVFVGLISYSLYLWHWPVFVLMKWTTGLEEPVQMAFAIFATFFLAISSFFLVERPIRSSKIASRVPRYAVVSTGLALVLCSSYFAKLINENKKYLSLSIVEKNSEDWHQSYQSFSDEKCKTTSERGRLSHGEVITLKRSCSRSQEEPKPQTQLFAIGDSHLGTYTKMLERLAHQTDIIVHIYSNGGCPFARLLYPTQEQCTHYESAALNDILKKAQRGDILFLPSLRLPRFGDQWASFGEAHFFQELNSEEAMQRRLLAEEETIKKLTPLASAGIVVIFEAPKPIFKAPAFRCSDWFNTTNPICRDGLSMKRKDIELYRAPVLGSFATLMKKLPSLRIWDPLPLLCPEPICLVTKDQKPLFTDGDHISGYANDILFNNFKSMVESQQKLPADRR